MDKEKYISEHDAYTENEVLEVTAQGIALKNGMYIDFAVCAEVWSEVNSLKSTRCVADRDATDYSFTFYTLPRPTTIRFIPKRRPVEYFLRNSAYGRFRNLQKTIIEYGYKTYDMS